MSAGAGSADEGRQGAEARVLVRALLREAVEHERHEGRLTRDAIRGEVRAACACAHGGGLPIEWLLVLVKEEWRAAPEARGLRRTDATRVLERVVTLCIDEFYAARPTH